MKKFVLAPVLAALAMFIWGFLFWGLPHNLPYRALSTVADEAETALAIGKLFPASGAYIIPSPLSDPNKVEELARRGPSVEVHIRKESLPLMDPAVMIAGYLHALVIAVVLTGLVAGLEKSFSTWQSRVRFCTTIGLLVAIVDLGDAIWWRHGWAWTLGGAAYNLVMFALAGLVIAWFVAPKRVPAPSV